jgi:hypothetical protein
MPRVRRVLKIVGLCVALALAYVLAHCALIETGREVIVLHTQNEDGSWLETRLWIVDDGGVSWLHGDARSRWERNLAARPVVEVTRGGETHRYPRDPGAGPAPEAPRPSAREVRDRGCLGAIRGRRPRERNAGEVGEDRGELSVGGVAPKETIPKLFLCRMWMRLR